jgi:hypothetical protein
MNDETFDALANEYRRSLLVALFAETPEPDTVHSGAENTVAAVPTELASGFALAHIHLPKLEDHGFIKWDKDANEVAKGPQFPEIRPLLECLADHAENEPGQRVAGESLSDC